MRAMGVEQVAGLLWEAQRGSHISVAAMLQVGLEEEALHLAAFGPRGHRAENRFPPFHTHPLIRYLIPVPPRLGSLLCGCGPLLRGELLHAGLTARLSALLSEFAQILRDRGLSLRYNPMLKRIEQNLSPSLMNARMIRMFICTAPSL
jgi:hypothetical protein